MQVFHYYSSPISTQEALIEIVTRDTSDIEQVVLNAPYLADGVTVKYEDGGEWTQLYVQLNTTSLHICSILQSSV